jgi:hypothetical protein
MRNALAVVVVSLVAVFSTAVAAAAPTGTHVSLAGQADFITAFNTIAYVTASCTGGGTGIVTVQIQQAQPPLASGTGSGVATVICDGTSRKYAVPLGGGPMHLGDAAGVATLVAPSGTESDAGNVRITRP